MRVDAIEKRASSLSGNRQGASCYHHAHRFIYWKIWLNLGAYETKEVCAYMRKQDWAAYIPCYISCKVIYDSVVMRTQKQKKKMTIDVNDVYIKEGASKMCFNKKRCIHQRERSEITFANTMGYLITLLVD